MVRVSGTDADAPTVTSSLSPAEPDGNNGWYITNPTVTFECADVTTLVVNCPEDEVLGEGTSTTGAYVYDLAGNTGSFSGVLVKVDTVAPRFQLWTDSQPNSRGWYNEAIAVNVTVNADASGVVMPDAPGWVTKTTDVELTVYDNAGNSRTKTRIFKVDTRDPSVRIPGLEVGEEYRVVPDLPCKASDGKGASASGVGSCRTTVEKLRGTNYRATAVAKDKAGNRAQESVRFVVL